MWNNFDANRAIILFCRGDFEKGKMFGKGGFEGNFRTTPNQSIGGASKGESKEELLRRAQEERKAREAKRNKTAAATKVQALIRGHLARCRHRRQARKEFEELQKRIQNDKNPPDLANIRLCCVLVLHGGEGGAWCCGLLVKYRELLLPTIAQDSGWCFLMCRLLGHATHILSTTDSNASLAPPLRVLEEFTRESNYPQNGGQVVARMYRHLFTKEKYFRQVLAFPLFFSPYTCFLGEEPDREENPTSIGNNHPTTHPFGWRAAQHGCKTFAGSSGSLSSFYYF